MVYIVLQIGLLMTLARVAQINLSLSAKSFSPAFWIITFYTLGFVLPQIYFPAAKFELLGTGESALRLSWSELANVQLYITIFLGCIVAGFTISKGKASAAGRYFSFTRKQLNFAYASVAVGFASVVALFLSLPPDAPRSELVQSGTGQVLFAVSYFFILGTFAVSANLMEKRKYAVAVALIVIFGASMLSLGGRGRVLWPLVGLGIWTIQTGVLRVSLKDALLWALAAGILLISLDPILLFARGVLASDQAIEMFKEDLSLQSFFYSRNFDGFNNFSLIVTADVIVKSIDILLDGVQREFMSTYYPSVMARGIGIPATLPGGLWIIGGPAALVTGGLIFGVFFGLLHRIFVSIRSKAGLLAYVLAMPLLANIGTSYIDSGPKIIAATVPGLLLCLIDGNRKVSRRRMGSSAV